MILPVSFKASGFVAPAEAIKTVNGKLRNFTRLMIGTEGDTNTGKTEFIFSVPGPGMMISLDKNFDATVLNPIPPVSRRMSDWAIKVIAAPQMTQATKPEYVTYWKDFYAALVNATENPQARALAIDGDSDSWELQQLAEWGTTTGVPGPPGLAYTGVNAARRAMISRLWQSGKIIIATNKLHDEYVTNRDEQGSPILTKEGKESRSKSGNRSRQGFKDHEYLWQIQLRHLFKPAGFSAITKKRTAPQWGLRILMCKPNMALVGHELWGDVCNFKGLVQLVFPQVPLSDWGF